MRWWSSVDEDGNSLWMFERAEVSRESPRSRWLSSRALVVLQRQSVLHLRAWRNLCCMQCRATGDNTLRLVGTRGVKAQARHVAIIAQRLRHVLAVRSDVCFPRVVAISCWRLRAARQSPEPGGLWCCEGFRVTPSPCTESFCQVFTENLISREYRHHLMSRPDVCMSNPD